MIIGLAGRARSGKDTVGKMLTTMLGGQTYAFAEPIKEATKMAFGLTNRHVHGDLKEVPLPEYGNRSPRYLMQKMGTEFGRMMVDNDVWITRAEKAYERTVALPFIITDVRFDNEANWIRSMGGVVCHIHRNDAESVNAHISEGGVTLEDNDRQILNDGSLCDLRKQVETVFYDYPGRTLDLVANS